jgi:hypothetical protein
MPTMQDVRESLETATRTVAATKDESHYYLALVTLLDAVTNCAALLGVPNAIEPNDRRAAHLLVLEDAINVTVTAPLAKVETS